MAPPTAVPNETSRLPTAPALKTLSAEPGAALGVAAAVPDAGDAAPEGVPLLEPPLTRAVRDGSESKSTVMEAFLHSERDGAVPVTKFTGAHCGRDVSSSCGHGGDEASPPSTWDTGVGHEVRGRFGGAHVSLTAYNNPSGEWATTPTTPLFPANSAGTATCGSQKAPRPVCSTMGNTWVQFPDAVWSRVARKSHLVCGWPFSMPTPSPETWKSVAGEEEEAA